MKNLIEQIDFAVINKMLRVFFENAGKNIEPPDLERRADLSTEELEQAWVDWILTKNLPDNVLEEWSRQIGSYVAYKTIPKGFGPSPKAKSDSPTAAKPKTPVPAKERPDTYVPTGPMTKNKYGKWVRTDSGVGRPPPNLGPKA